MLELILAAAVIFTLIFSILLIIIRIPSFPESFVKPPVKVLKGFAGVPSGVAILAELLSM